MSTGLNGQRMFKWAEMAETEWCLGDFKRRLGRFSIRFGVGLFSTPNPPRAHEPTSALHPPLFSTPTWPPPSPSLSGARRHPGRSRRSTGPPPREASPPTSFPPRPAVALTVELSAGALPSPRQSTPAPCPRTDLRQGLSRKTPGREVRAPRGAPPASRELARPVVCR
jgi:hypothetical protein